MKRNSGGFTLVEIMIVIMIIAILLAIAIPSFLRMREVGRARACQSTLRQIATAKEQWAMDHRANLSSTPTPSDLVDDYIKHKPVGELPECPVGGDYAIGSLANQPTCSIGFNSGAKDWDNHIIQW